MDRSRVNYLVDLGMAVSFAVVAFTGIMKLPALSGRARDYMLLHDISGVVLAALVLLHLVLHYNWIVAMTKGFFKKK